MKECGWETKKLMDSELTKVEESFADSGLVMSKWTYKPYWNRGAFRHIYMADRTLYFGVRRCTQSFKSWNFIVELYTIDYLLAYAKFTWRTHMAGGYTSIPLWLTSLKCYLEICWWNNATMKWANSFRTLITVKLWGTFLVYGICRYNVILLLYKFR